MSVEGIPQRDVLVTFDRHHLSYNAGESAYFTADEAARLADLGVVEGPPPTEAPVNTAVPHVQQDGAVLTCTMGEWEGKPTAYSYQWTADGSTNIGSDAASYTVSGLDSGTTIACVVTASNAIGSTAAPPSNGVVVA